MKPNKQTAKTKLSEVTNVADKHQKIEKQSDQTLQKATLITYLLS